MTMTGNPTTPGTVTPNRDVHRDSPDALRTSEVLTGVECWALLATRSIGRLCSSRDGLPDNSPVNFVVLADHLHFRTSADIGIPTDYLEHAALQVDDVDEGVRSRWTILLNGAATRVEDPAILDALWGDPMDGPGAPGQRDLFFELAPTFVRGRRLGTTRLCSPARPSNGTDVPVIRRHPKPPM
jgi:hypothetical protein